MSLNYRQRMKVNAALSLISLHGHSPRPVQSSAKAHMAKGIPSPEAYTLALNEFVDRTGQGLRQTLTSAIELVGASDDATLAKYDAAITAYNETGDASQFDAIAPMIVEDAKALAIRNGDATEADTLYWDVQDALGIDTANISATPDLPDASTPADGSPTTSTFQFANAVPPKPAEQPQQPPQPSHVNPGQTSLTASPTGYSASASGRAEGPAAYGAGQTGGTHGATGYRAPMAGEKARQWHGTPMGGVPHIQTATGYRVAPTGEQARREAGVPLGDHA